MRLLLTTDAVGGVWTYALDLARALAGRNIEIVLAVLGPSPSDSARHDANSIERVELVETGLALDWLASEAADVESASKALADLTARARADLVQLHAPALALAEFPVPVISVVHSCVATWSAAVKQGPLPDDLAWRARQARQGILRSDRVIAPTRAFASAVQETYALAKTPLAVHNGRDAVTGSATRTEDALLTVGRLWDEGKNLGALDRAAARLTVPVRAVGSLAGPEGSAVEVHHVDAVGLLHAGRLAAQYARQPIFVSAAKYEPFGLAVLEAAQAGCALLLSDIPTFRELWGGAALFFPPDDDERLAELAEGLLDDRAERHRLGAAAQARAAGFTTAATADAMMAHYGDLIERADRRAA